MPPVELVTREEIEEILRDKDDGERGEAREKLALLRDAKSPKQVHEVLYTKEGIAGDLQLPDSLVKKVLARAAKLERALSKQLPLRIAWAKMAPFCHGTDDYSADTIKKEGITPRAERGDLVGSYGESPDLISMPDRSYLGTSEWGGVRKCIEGAKLAAEQQASDGKVLFFDERVLDLDPVADEDCMGVKGGPPVPNAYESARECKSFGVRNRIPPEFVTEVADIEFRRRGDLSKSIDRACAAASGGGKSKELECAEKVKDSFNRAIGEEYL